MGPPEETPEFPVYDSWVHPEGNRLVPYKIHNPCNWLQSHENGADPIHTCFLHARGNELQFSEQYTALPTLSFFETPIGLLSLGTRRWDDYLWVRASDVILPNAAQFGLAEVASEEKFALCAWVSRWIVPIDNTNAYAIGLRHFNPVIDPHGTGDAEAIGLGKVDFPGQVAAPTHEEGQRNPGDFEAQVAQGPVTDPRQRDPRRHRRGRHHDAPPDPQRHPRDQAGPAARLALACGRRSPADLQHRARLARAAETRDRR